MLSAIPGFVVKPVHRDKTRVTRVLSHRRRPALLTDLSLVGIFRVQP